MNTCRPSILIFAYLAPHCGMATRGSGKLSSGSQVLGNQDFLLSHVLATYAMLETKGMGDTEQGIRKSTKTRRVAHERNLGMLVEYCRWGLQGLAVISELQVVFALSCEFSLLAQQ